MDQCIDEKPLRDVIRFAAEQAAVPESRICAESRLAEDLGLDGDDAHEFMTAFAKRFSVNLDGFMFSRHFGAEASATPWSVVNWLFPVTKFEPITIERLARVAIKGEWH